MGESIREGPVRSPRSDEIVIGTMTLYQKGYPWDEAKQWVTQAFDEADTDSDWREKVADLVVNSIRDLKFF